MFTIEHFIWIALCILFVEFLLNFAVKHHFSFHQASIIMAIIAVASETSKIISQMVYVNGVDASNGMVLDAHALPFHLCSLFIFLFFYFPFSTDTPIRRRCINFFVPMGLIGAAAAILIPTNGTDFLNIEAYQCFVYHAGMLWFACYLIKTKQADLGKSELLKNMITMFAIMIMSIWINSFLQVYDTNFLYVVRPPMENLPILNLNHGWFRYILALIILGTVGLTAVHLPFIYKETKQKH